MSCPSGIDDPRIRSQWLAANATVKSKEGSFLEAVELFSEAINLNRDDFRYFNNRCWCYLKLKDFERSFKDSEKSIELNPFKWKGFFNRGRALVGLKRYAEAERSFKTAKDLAGKESNHNFDEEIRKVKYLMSVKEYMEPKGEDRGKCRLEQQDSFLGHFWSDVNGNI